MIEEGDRMLGEKLREVHKSFGPAAPHFPTVHRFYIAESLPENFLSSFLAIVIVNSLL